MSDDTVSGITGSNESRWMASSEHEMLTRAPFERALSRILWELRPYLADLIVIGGWVPYLHQRYGNFTTWRGQLSLTIEVDVLITHELPLRGRPSLAATLQSADFQPTPSTGVAAVWANDPDRGEKIEFLVPHTGPFRDLGTVVRVGGQAGIGAISLASLDVLQRHTTTLTVPALSPDETRQLIPVRVPRLGAYVINKTATFLHRRPSGDGSVNPKRAKDLLYLRDLMAAGSEVVDAIERDITGILALDPSMQHLVDTAANNLDGTVRPGSRIRLDEVGAMLAERERGMSQDAASASVTGHLTDLAGLLLALRSPAPPRSADDSDDDV